MICHLPQRVRQTLLRVISQSIVKGNEAKLVVETVSILNANKPNEVYVMEDPIRNFIKKLLGDVDIKGQDAMLVLEAQVALEKEYNPEKETGGSKAAKDDEKKKGKT